MQPVYLGSLGFLPLFVGTSVSARNYKDVTNAHGLCTGVSLVLGFEEEEFCPAACFLSFFFFLADCASTAFKVEAELASDVTALAGKLVPEGNPNSFCLSIHSTMSARSSSYFVTDSIEGYAGRTATKMQKDIVYVNRVLQKSDPRVFQDPA